MITRFLSERDGYKCRLCGIADWLGNPLTLDIDHVDGVVTNNLPANLRLLCPNCHRQTPTWGNKARGQDDNEKDLLVESQQHGA